LGSKLQNDKRIYNKWESRSKVGIYLGHSPLHARNIALVLNMDTGLVSPQFHVRFDKSFETIEKPPHHRWLAMAGFTGDKRSAVTLTSQGDFVQSKRRRKDDAGKPDYNKATVPPDTVPTRMHPNYEIDGKISNQNKNNIKMNQTHQLQPAGVAAKATRAIPSKPEGDIEAVKRNEEILYAHQLMIVKGNQGVHPHDIHIYKATSDPDTLYHHQAMKQPDADKFRVAMAKEWEDQRRNDNFEIRKKSEVPKGTTILPSVWQMRRKREVSTGKIKKYKARLNLDGSRMKKGIDYQLTYAPVVRWSSIRLTLLLSILNEWKTIKIDYVHAYPQAPIEKKCI